MKNWKLINVLGGCCVVMAFLFILFPLSMAWVKCERGEEESKVNQTQHEMRAAATEIKSIQFVGQDSISKKLEAIRCNQLHVLDQQDKLINDFRQEMNNNINKVNTWLAYAIGIMGLVGVFIPIVIQFKIRSDEKERIEKEEQELKEKMNELDEASRKNEAIVGQKLQEYKDNMAQWIAQEKERTGRLQEELERKILQMNQQFAQGEDKLNQHIQEQKKETSTWVDQCEERMHNQQMDIDQRMLRLEQIFAQKEAQFNLHIQSQKNELDKHIERLDNHSRSQIKNLEEKTGEIDEDLEQIKRVADKCTKDVEENIQRQKAIIADRLRALQREYQLHRLWSRFMGFTVCYEDKALKDQSDRNALLKYIWSKVQETFGDIVAATCDKQDVDEFGRISIVLSLTILNSVIKKIKNHPDVNVYRRFDTIESEVKKLLEQLIKSIDNHAIVMSVSGEINDLNHKVQKASLPI